MPDLDAAADFVWRHARVLDRHRFSVHFEGAPAEPLLRALAAYRNDDGGFGHGLEPDLRGPESQPAGAQSALETLAEAGAAEHPLADGAIAWLEAHVREDGGVPFCLPSSHPRGPWWRDADASSLTQTAANAAAAHGAGRGIAALDGFVWRRAEALDFLDNAYDTHFTIAFLDAHPDEPRATAALDTLGDRIEAVVGSDPAAPDEAHAALDFSPWPDARSRRLFDPAQIERDLDALERAQREDGGWDFDWPHWSPAATLDWRGYLTVHNLRVLQANGRL